MGKMENKKIFKHKTFNELWDDPEFLTESEKEKIDFDVMLIGKLIAARESKGYTQKVLAEKVGIKQSALARLEGFKATPQINTLNKILKPLGYKLDIVRDVPRRESITNVSDESEFLVTV